MSLTPEEIRKIAHLARIELNEKDIPLYAQQLSNILAFVEQLQQVDTTDIAPMAHPLNEYSRSRPDMVTEHNQRELFQQIAPQVAQGLYLVPRVIE